MIKVKVEYHRKQKHKFYKSDPIKSRITYRGSVLHGKCELFNEQGDVIISCYYYNGELHGDYYSNRGHTRHNLGRGYYAFEHDEPRKCHYVHGKLHGLCQHFNENGSVSVECTYVNGNIHGELTEYYSTGEPLHRIMYHHGMRKGESRYYNSIKGILTDQLFYSGNEDITEKVLQLIKNPPEITEEERLLIKLKFGLSCLK